MCDDIMSANGVAEMADDRMRIALWIRNEDTDGGLEGPYVIWLGQGELLCPVLEEYRSVANWYSVRSVNVTLSPHLKWIVVGHAADETRATVNGWGASLWTMPTSAHRLTLTTNSAPVRVRAADDGRTQTACRPA